MTRPLIGVTGSAYRGFAMWVFNAFNIWMAGGRAVRITPPAKGDEFDELDGLLIGGGDDISAELYQGQIVVDIRVDPERDALELQGLETVVPKGVPVLGACRGAQILNVYFGGTLHEDIHAIYETAPHTRTVLPRKRVHLQPGTKLYDLIGRDNVVVNSLHHQSVDELGLGCVVSGRDTHGIVQAIEVPELCFVLGVQWHPEFLFYRSSQRALFRALVAAAKAGRDGREEKESGTRDAAHATS